MQLLPQRTPALDVQRHVDRLVRHAHLRIRWERARQPPRYLLWRPLECELSLDDRLQRNAPSQLGRLAPAGETLSTTIGRAGSVSRSALLALHLPAHCRRSPPQANRDCPEALPLTTVRARSPRVQPGSALSRRPRCAGRTPPVARCTARTALPCCPQMRPAAA
jgi:hypothetical protein